jgi:hypothetical protein
MPDGGGSRTPLLRKKAPRIYTDFTNSNPLFVQFDGIGKLKSELFYNVNRQIALEAMFLELDRHG